MDMLMVVPEICSEPATAVTELQARIGFVNVTVAILDVIVRVPSEALAVALIVMVEPGAPLVFADPVQVVLAPLFSGLIAVAQSIKLTFPSGSLTR